MVKFQNVLDIIQIVGQNHVTLNQDRTHVVKLIIHGIYIMTTLTIMLCVLTTFTDPKCLSTCANILEYPQYQNQFNLIYS